MNGKSIASLSLKERLANLEKYVDALRTVFSVTSFICSCVGLFFPKENLAKENLTNVQ